MMLKIGLVGAGYIGGVHARILAADERVKLVGFADVVEKRAQELANQFGGKAYTDYEQLLSSGIDAVYVTTPNTLHTPIVLSALTRGIHVFCEKPMAITFEDAKRIREAARASKGLYQIGHNRRFAPVYQFAKEKIAQGLVPYSANVKMNRGELKNPPWVWNKDVTGGFLFESTIHLLDMIRWLMGEVLELDCRARANVYPDLDDFVMILTFENDRYAAFSSCAHATWSFPFERIELYGDHAAIITEEMEKVTYSPGLGQEIVRRDYFQLTNPEKWGYIKEDQLFVTAVLEGKAPPVTVDDAYKSIELVEACYQSARSGQRVALPLA